MLDDGIEFCDGDVWKPSYHAPLGRSRSTPARSCQAILDANDHILGKNKYWVYVPADNYAGEDVFLTTCSFTASGNTVTVQDFGG